MQNLQGFSPVPGMHPRHHRAAVQRGSLRQADRKIRRHQHRNRLCGGNRPVSQQITQGQGQHGGPGADLSGQISGQECRQHVADAHQGEQSARLRVGQSEFFLQQTDHHAAGNGADSAEKKRAVSPASDSRFIHGSFLRSLSAPVFSVLPEEPADFPSLSPDRIPLFQTFRNDPAKSCLFPLIRLIIICEMI